MENEHVITGLLRKRQSIADDLDAAQNKVRLLIQAIDAVDATIKLFQPDISSASSGSARRRAAKRLSEAKQPG